MSDPELVQRMSRGDEKAFVTLYRRRQAGIYRFALQMSGKPEVAEEITQEVFLILIHDPSRYDPERGSVAAYLYGVARNLILRGLEGERVHLSVEEEEAADHLTGSDDLLGDLAREERLAALRRAILSLPLAYREVVALCDLQEMDYAGAAAVLECPVGTVRSRLHRARALLAAKLRGPAERCVI